MSAAAVRNRAVFDEAIALADQIAGDGRKVAPKEGFAIHFVDLGVISGFTPAELIAARNTGLQFHQIPGIPMPRSSRRPLGDPYISSLIGVTYPDGIRDLAYAEGAGKASQMLPGFGPALRNTLHNHDAYRLPDRGATCDNASEVMKYMGTAILGAVAYKGLTALGMAAGAGTAVLGGLIGLVLWEGGSWLVGAVVVGEGSGGEVAEPTDAGPPPPAGGIVDDPDEETKMPIPDEASGGRTNPLDVLDAALRYLTRLDPLINPTQENLGNGYVAVHLPQPGNIDPMWEVVRSSRPSEADVLAGESRLGFGLI
jgi:hypothetical protein